MKYAIMNNGEFVEATYDPCTKKLIDVKIYLTACEAIFNSWRKGEYIVEWDGCEKVTKITEPLEEDLCPGW